MFAMMLNVGTRMVKGQREQRSGGFLFVDWAEVLMVEEKLPVYPNPEAR